MPGEQQQQLPDWGSMMSQMNNMQMPGQAQQQNPGQGPAQPPQAHHPMKKQLLQHMIQAFMNSPKTTVQDAIAGMKGLMSSYKGIASELDKFMPGNTADFERSPAMQGTKNAMAGAPRTPSPAPASQGATSTPPAAPAPQGAAPPYSPMGGNSSATMAAHYPNGTPPGPMTPGVQNPASQAPYLTP